MPFNLGPVELIVILVIALIVVGPGKLPDVGAALGRSIREFRKAATDVQDAAKVDTDPASQPTKAVATPSPVPPAATTAPSSDTTAHESQS